MADAYVVQNLTKVYRGASAPANDRICLNIGEGVLLALLGPNGAGKTTLVRQLAGLLRPTSGEIRLFGQDVVRQPEMVPHLVGYYGQQVQALAAHRFSEVLWMTGMLRGQSRKAARQQAEELLERFDLVPLAARVTAELSGGERRMAGVLASLMAHRPLLILDEPTNDLDPRRRQILWDYLHESNQREKTTVIVVSHNLHEVETVAHQAALIDRGRLVACGSLGELKRSVADRLRVELRLREDTPAACAIMAGIEGARRHKSGIWKVYTTPDQAAPTLQRLLETLGTELVDDFRLITPTLDDVYEYFTGGNGE